MRPLVAWLFSALAPAQVYLVDSMGGPGVSFTSIAAAVAAVPNGAVLQVYPGIYGGFAIAGKSLTVIALGTVEVRDGNQPPIRVSNLAVGQSVALYGLSVDGRTVTGAIECASCAGTIVLDGCRGTQSVAFLGGRIVATDCAQLHLRHCFFHALDAGGAALQLTDSHAVATECSFGAEQAPAVDLVVSRLDALATGCYGYASPPAVRMAGGELVLRGGCVLTGAGPGSLLVDGVGNVRLDPATALLYGASPPFGTGVGVSVTPMPYQRGWPGTLGSLAAATLEGPAGSLGALVVGFAGPPLSVAGLSDPVWLRPGSATVHAVGVPPLHGNYAVPSAAWVLGVTVCWQGVVLGGAGLQLANPAVYAHH